MRKSICDNRSLLARCASRARDENMSFNMIHRVYVTGFIYKILNRTSIVLFK